MNPLHKSLDETVALIRTSHESELKDAKDAQFAAEVRATLLQDQLARAIEARATAERICAKLIAQFGMVEAVFAEAKALALAQAEESELVDDPRLPEVKP